MAAVVRAGPAPARGEAGRPKRQGGPDGSRRRARQTHCVPISRPEGRGRFLTWAMSVAIRVAMSELRRRKWKDVSLDKVVAGGGLTPGRAIVDEPGPDAQWQREAILAAMHEVIRTGLTEKQCSALLVELRDAPGRDRPAPRQQPQRHLQADARRPQAAEARPGGGRVHGRGRRHRVRRVRKGTISLSTEEIAELLRLIGLTRDEEIDCERCLARVAEFAERSLCRPVGPGPPAGRPPSPVDLLGMLRGVRIAPSGAHGHGGATRVLVGISGGQRRPGP